MLWPITWTVDSGALPAGLSIVPGTTSSSASLAGTPSAGGTSTFTLVATDATGRQHLISGNTITVGGLAVSPSTPALPPAISGVAYSQALTASGGTAPYQFRLLSTSDMPLGVNLSAGGVLSGTPSISTDCPFLLQVEAVDALGTIFFKRYKLDAAYRDGIIPSGGGTVQDSIVSGAAVTAPAGVLPNDTNVAIQVQDPSLSYPLPTGFTAAASYYVDIQLAPQPSFPLQAPGATLVLPLLSPQTPGTLLSLFYVDPATGTLAPALDSSGNPISGPVDVAGLTATFAGVTHFSTFVALRRTTAPLQITANFYLHGSGATANPATLFLDVAAPTGTTAKYRDSAGVNFNGGNPWKELGVWGGAKPSGAFQDSSVRTWIGLKNSDDQGTRFDLRVEVYKNLELAAAGETYCIQGVTRNENSAVATMVGLGSLAGVVFNGSSDLLSVRVLTRIGTSGGALCGGHSNATGLRLYFDSVEQGIEALSELT